MTMILRSRYYREGHSDVKARKSTFFNKVKLRVKNPYKKDIDSYIINEPISNGERILKAVLLALLFTVIGFLCYIVGGYFVV